MQVYKAYFKIIKKNIGQLSIYLIIFLLFAIIFGKVSTSPKDTDFESTKVNISIINKDENSKLISGLRDYLKENANIVDVGTSKEDLQDALFFREAEYIITIPKGFTKEILKGNKDINIEKTVIPNSTSEIYMDNLINRYLNTVKMYTSTIDNISQAKLVSNVNKDLSHTTDVKIKTYDNDYSNNASCANYYNFFAYSMFAVLILGISLVMISFNNKDLKRRNLASSLSMKNMNIQMVFANITYAVVVWFVMIIASFIMFKNYMFTINGLLSLLNSFVFTLAALSISILISNLVTSRNALSAVVNVIALGSCFISGVFVPQQYLGDTVLSIAKFNPTYWYVKANDDIAILVNYSNENMRPIFMSMIIVLGFALAVYAVTLVVIKQKRLSN
ncbi:MAG: ABC transporter permease [Clostridiales bacterium]|uniref:ABC transporter permease n=1 Tax=Terrisporobacter sp. TaxID=1965305 RepID=UPI002A4BCED2|nr:ABC transporter permease [Terrisporobacter sp.]MCI5628632.1 ABC transporter permease [Clostridium sp.]MDD5878308.1 ABC transporter permease [Clostridiales bacterium]MDD7755187.1 ABC transporter permease [Clostridiales bacterium]MDY4135648.1 ABC transporter permease [Terrisporobacter sp.]MDY4736148.1 ABC transporter permease [Terrisporobacter sp.]